MAKGKDFKLDLGTLGSTGLPVYSGRIYDESLVELDGEHGRKVLREMSEQDPIIGGVLLGVELLSRQVPYTIKAADESDKAHEIADFVDEALTDMSPSWEDTLSEILSYLTYGWSWLEIIYKRRQGLKPNSPQKSSRFDDDKIGWGGWSIRSQETLDHWEFSEGDKGELVAMHQWAPPDYKAVRIPRNKSLHFKTRSRRENPEGVSILRNAYRPWYMKKNIEIIEGIGVERDLAGLPVLWAPSNLFSANASADEQSLFAKLQKIVTSIKRDEQEGILMPMAFDEEGKNPLYKLELLSTGGDRQFDTNAIINRYDERIAMSMLADFILMGHQAVGSYALSTTKTGLFSTALSAFLDLIVAEINMQAIPRLVLLNGWSLKDCPTLQHGKIDTTDLSKLGSFLKQLSDAGMAVFPNQLLEKYLLETAGLPGDPGVGELPMPVLDENGMPIPPVVGPDGQPLPPPPPLPPNPLMSPVPSAAKPPATKPAGRPAPVAPQKPTAKRPIARAAHEPTTTFTPLAVRVARLSKQLMAELPANEYRSFLEAVLKAGSFDELSSRYQDLISEAESGE
jgi:dsDNA-binding SOS-regulon protein